MSGKRDILHALDHLPVVMCPGCLVEMIVRDLEPVPVNQYNALYRCPKCTTETRRIFKAEAVR